MQSISPLEKGRVETRDSRHTIIIHGHRVLSSLPLDPPLSGFPLAFCCASSPSRDLWAGGLHKLHKVSCPRHIIAFCRSQEMAIWGGHHPWPKLNTALKRPDVWFLTLLCRNSRWGRKSGANGGMSVVPDSSAFAGDEKERTTEVEGQVSSSLGLVLGSSCTSHTSIVCHRSRYVMPAMDQAFQPLHPSHSIP